MSIANFASAVRALASANADAATVANIIANESLLPDYGIDTPLKIAHFLSQTAHESGGFKRAVENLRYSTAARLQAVWPTRFPTEEAAEPYVDNPEKLANLVYANRLGNGGLESGDGFRFRGRGLIQITGRNNYHCVGKVIGLDLESDPDQAAAPDHAMLVACGTWKFLGLDALPETASVAEFTKKVNGGTVGLADRQALFTKARTALGI